jgi:hypothetical protein
MPMLRAFIIASTVVALGAALSAQADSSATALKTCLADNTSGKDRTDLARWLFLALAAHPALKDDASANAAAAGDESSRTMAALVTRLFTESCLNETRAVLQTGQPQSLQFAMEGLGQLAIRELMADKSVQASMNLFQRYVDQQRFNEALTAK